MKRLALALSVAAFAVLATVATVAAADPTPTPAATPATIPATGPAANANRGVMIPAILGLTHEEVMALRQQGLTLAQIAERKDVDPQVLIDALAAQWTVRIDARLALGAITADQAAALKADVAVRAKAFVNQVPLGGMGGQAVGAGQGGGMGMHAQGTGIGTAGQGAGTGFRGGRGAAQGGWMHSATPIPTP